MRKKSSHQIIEQVRKWWFSYSREECYICGSKKAHDLDEEWMYYVEGDEGLAILRNVKPIREECHNAKHIGRAKVTGQLDRALKHLAKINNITSKEKIEEGINAIFEMWEKYSRINKWKIIIECDIPLKKDVERLLNSLVYSRSLFFVM